ncbi:hypothetical protein ACFE04_009944 [Oxalis oulophora]
MHHHKHTFIALFFLLTLPLSLLTFSLSFSTLSTTHNILHLESIASLTPTRFEARQILKETRADAYSIFLTKSLYFSLSFPLSLIATASSVSTAAAKPSPLKISFPRLLATSIVTYAVLLLYSITTRVASTIISTWFPSFGLGLVMFLIGSGFEIYLMCVTSIGLVVSVLEEKVGLEAIRVGLNIIEGRKVVGWVLSASGVAVSGWITWKWEKAMDGVDLENGNILTVVMSDWVKIGLVFGYGLFMIWSYIVTTVFYCGCKRRQRHNDNDNNEVEVDSQSQSQSLVQI